jgi:hypothetical protein
MTMTGRAPTTIREQLAASMKTDAGDLARLLAFRMRSPADCRAELAFHVLQGSFAIQITICLI